MRSELKNHGYDDAAIDKMKPAAAWRILREPVKAPVPTMAAEPTAPEMTAKRGGRPRSAAVEEVQAYLYRRWIKGDKLAAIRAGGRREVRKCLPPKRTPTLRMVAAA